jgi:hypothetical protein
VEYNAVMAMCKALGIGPIFLSWINNILHTASTSVLLNGVPRKKSYAKEVLDKGIHFHLYFLSPLLSYSNVLLIRHVKMV